MGSSSSRSTRSTTNVPTFLETYALQGDHKALEEHLRNNGNLQQWDLNKCLLRGLQMVQRNQKRLSHVAPALTLLLQYGATWNKHDLLPEKKTPLQIICESPVEHRELLYLMIKSCQQKIIATQMRALRG